MLFDCPQCKMSLAVLPEERSSLVNCPECGTPLPATLPSWPATVEGTTDDEQRTGAYSSVADSALRPRPGVPAVPGYDMEALIGRGGMGVVYRARHQRLKRLTALKMIRSGAHADVAELARFQTEAETIARLQHPHIVQIYEIGTHDGMPFVALEFVPGGSLADRLKLGMPTPQDAARLTEKMARAMHAAHQRGVVHRDLKPANVLLTSDGEPKITDFGLAKQLETDSGQTRTGQIVGTPSYMAPEQAAGQLSLIGPRTDVYALSAILYELLTGRPPCRGESVAATLDIVRTGRILPPRQVERHIPRDLETICLKGLELEPSRRYGSAAELAEDLWRYLGGETIRARRVGLLDRGWRWCKRKPVVAALLGVLGAGLVGLAMSLWLLHRSEQRSDAAFEVARRTLTETFAKFSDPAQLERAQGAALRDQLISAVPLYEQQIQRRPQERGLRAELGRVHLRLAMIDFLHTGPAEALAATEKARELYTHLVAAQPSQAEYRQELANAWSNRAILMQVLSRYPEAEVSFREALVLREAVHDAMPNAVEPCSALAGELDYFGAFLEGQNRFAEAEAKYRAALDRHQVNLDASPQNIGLLGYQARFAFNQGAMLAALERRPEAEAVFRRGLAWFDQVIQASIDVYARDLGQPTPSDLPVQAPALLSIAGLAYKEYGPQVLRKPITFFQQAVQAAPAEAGYRGDLAQAQHNLALLLTSYRHARDDVPKLAAEALAGFDRSPPDDRDILVRSGRNCALLGLLLLMNQEVSAGQWQLAEAVRRLERAAAGQGSASHRKLLFQARLGHLVAQFQRDEYRGALVEMDALLGTHPEESERLRSVSEKIVFRVQERMVMQGREGRAADCLAGARLLARSRSATGVALYEAACILGKQAGTASDAKEKEESAVLAIAALREAFRRGFTAGAQAASAFRGQDPLDYMQKDTDFVPLRKRADYQKLVMELQAARKQK